MELLIKNGQIVTATDSYQGDLLCRDGKIFAIGTDLSLPGAGEVIDASGKYVFPGFIDPHVHIYLPFMGTFAKDDYDSASRAALVGGTTTLIEMCCPGRDDEPLEAFELWRSQAEGISRCDYTWHMGVTRFDERAADQVREIVSRGIRSLKVFLAYKGALGVDDSELWGVMQLASELDVIVTAHCENASLIAERQQMFLQEGKVGPEWHEPSRPVQVEAEGVHHLLTFAELTGTRVYIVHTSCQRAVEVAQAGLHRGVDVTVETVVPYLVLDDTFACRPDFEGAKYVMSPPIRNQHEQEFLWQALADGRIDVVATDHAPFDFAGQKEMGRGDFTKIPNGIPSVEDRINLLYTYGVKRGRISLQRMVEVASTAPAKTFGLFPRKGTIAVGSDADLVIYDGQTTGTLSASTQQMASDYSAFEGMAIEGKPTDVILRGQLQVRDGRCIAEPGSGQFLER